MISYIPFYSIEKTWHYIKEHEKEVPFSQVHRIVRTGRRKTYKNNIIRFDTENFYVLGKMEDGVLKIINAKRK